MNHSASISLKMHGTLVIFLLLWRFVNCDDGYNENMAGLYLKNLNKMVARRAHKLAEAEWNYQTDINNDNLQHKLIVSTEVANLSKSLWQETIKYPWQTFENEDFKRQFKEYSILGAAALPDDKFEALEKFITTMESNYATAKVCDYWNSSNCNLTLEPELTEIMANSRNEDELKYYWVEWRKKTGKPNRELFPSYVILENEAALLNNFSDTAEYWIHDYETKDLRKIISDLWREVRPFYLEIHAYVRRKLREKYGEDVVSKNGPIPAHLLGNMWAQTWSNIADFTLPFPEVKKENITKHLIEQKYTPEKMYRLADDFFKSIHMYDVSDSFWEKSILEKIPNREMICHASAWDFANQRDFRIRQCTRITEEDLHTAHHEMGHIQYFMQYKNQPMVYRGAANPGFHEAIGDVIGLSVSTPKHMHKIGLLPNYTQSREADLNYLFTMALEKVVFLPFSFIVDLWRWNAFKRVINERNYNREWWRFRIAYQGVEPPVERSEQDFDPASKYHVVASVPYIRYFVSFIIQFQFQEALCTLAGQFDPENPEVKPLHQCDIYQSKVAGNRLASMLKLGSSRPWPEAMEILTGKKTMDAKPLLRYFAPIYEWLREENRRTGEHIGWEESLKGIY